MELPRHLTPEDAPSARELAADTFDTDPAEATANQTRYAGIRVRHDDGTHGTIVTAYGTHAEAWSSAHVQWDNGANTTVSFSALTPITAATTAA